MLGVTEGQSKCSHRRTVVCIFRGFARVWMVFLLRQTPCPMGSVGVTVTAHLINGILNTAALIWIRRRKTIAYRPPNKKKTCIGVQFDCWCWRGTQATVLRHFNIDTNKDKHKKARRAPFHPTSVTPKRRLHHERPQVCWGVFPRHPDMTGKKTTVVTYHLLLQGRDFRGRLIS